jgi:hypothetical protein
MANVLCGVGLLVLLGVFCFVLFTVEGGPKKKVVLVTLQAVFYYLGATLLEQPHSELIGGAGLGDACDLVVPPLRCRYCAHSGRSQRSPRTSKSGPQSVSQTESSL